MTDKSDKKDLKWQKPEESENIQKSVNPDAGYMDSHSLCRKCHGAIKVCNLDGCPQKSVNSGT